MLSASLSACTAYVHTINKTIYYFWEYVWNHYSQCCSFTTCSTCCFCYSTYQRPQETKKNNNFFLTFWSLWTFWWTYISWLCHAVMRFCATLYLLGQSAPWNYFSTIFSVCIYVTQHVCIGKIWNFMLFRNALKV